jgi:cytochrome c-type biogenesis protein CcmF
MIPELGHFALVLALALALVQSILPLVGAARGVPQWVAVAVPAARAQLAFLALAFGALTYAFVTHDFSVAYVANNSNTAQPLVYRMSAVWGAHEGSLLLWALLLAVWTVAVTYFSRSLPAAVVARVVAVCGLVSIGFLLFMLLTSNPFDRLLPSPLQGRELNPLLQDPGLALHPPMLYMGYVGLAVPFAFSVAALIDGRLDAAWVRWARPWTAVAWVFLTLGIALGSWWAYYELGWGGWWFWDPVENASFMPWLVATALLHSLAVTEKRGAFKAWTVLLSIFAFSLSLLGTFLVRSGVLVSVHAFATDPARGVFILLFLGLVIGSSLILYAWRAASVTGGGAFELMSRETLLLLNNVLLVVAAASILLGTLYPLFLDALDLGKISVGPPYFDTVFVPLMLPLVLLVGLGPLTRWKAESPSVLLRRLWPLGVGAAAVAAALVTWLAGEAAVGVILGLSLSLWVLATALTGLTSRLRHGAGGLSRLAGLSRSFVGMHLAHLGLAVFVVGVTLSTAYSVEKDLRLAPEDSVDLGGYTFRFEGSRPVPGPNYVANRGTVRVFRDGQEVTVLHPEKRQYGSQESPMTEAAIDAGLKRDLYVALGEPLAGGAWSVRVYYKPFIQWIWLGATVMALGGLLAATDRRYRVATAAARAREGAAARADRLAVAARR